jgi:NDP-sugar pyrophosphorylase family protein
MENIRPIILAGGLGTRMRPTTYMVPKPLLLVGEHPIIEIAIRWLKTFGFKEIGIALGWRGKMIEYHLGDGSQFGVKLHYVTETAPLGTAGPLSLMKDWIGDSDVFVMNGDILTKLNLEEMVKFHKEKKSVLTVATREYESKLPLGVVVPWDDDPTSLKEIIERPTAKELISCGMYVISNEALAFIPRQHKLDMPRLIQEIIDCSNGLVAPDLGNYSCKEIRLFKFNDPWVAVEKMHELDEVSRDPVWTSWVENLCKS